MLYNACESYLFTRCYARSVVFFRVYAYTLRDFIKFFNYRVKDDVGSVRVAAGRAGEKKRGEIRGT